MELSVLWESPVWWQGLKKSPGCWGAWAGWGLPQVKGLEWHLKPCLDLDLCPLHLVWLLPKGDQFNHLVLPSHTAGTSTQPKFTRALRSSTKGTAEMQMLSVPPRSCLAQIHYWFAHLPGATCQKYNSISSTWRNRGMERSVIKFRQPCLT